MAQSERLRTRTALTPSIHQCPERWMIVFQGVDTTAGDTARDGDWAGCMKDMVRPLVQWQTRVEEPVHDVVTIVAGEQ